MLSDAEKRATLLSKRQNRQVVLRNCANKPLSNIPAHLLMILLCCIRREDVNAGGSMEFKTQFAALKEMGFATDGEANVKKIVAALRAANGDIERALPSLFD